MCAPCHSTALPIVRPVCASPTKHELRGCQQACGLCCRRGSAAGARRCMCAPCTGAPLHVVRPVYVVGARACQARAQQELHGCQRGRSTLRPRLVHCCHGSECCCLWRCMRAPCHERAGACRWACACWWAGPRIAALLHDWACCVPGLLLQCIVAMTGHAECRASTLPRCGAVLLALLEQALLTRPSPCPLSSMTAIVQSTRKRRVQRGSLGGT
jgi:hypothetical protein